MKTYCNVPPMVVKTHRHWVCTATGHRWYLEVDSVLIEKLTKNGWREERTVCLGAECSMCVAIANARLVKKNIWRLGKSIAEIAAINVQLNLYRKDKSVRA